MKDPSWNIRVFDRWNPAVGFVRITLERNPSGHWKIPENRSAEKPALPIDAFLKGCFKAPSHPFQASKTTGSYRNYQNSRRFKAFQVQESLSDIMWMTFRGPWHRDHTGPRSGATGPSHRPLPVRPRLGGWCMHREVLRAPGAGGDRGAAALAVGGVELA